MKLCLCDGTSPGEKEKEYDQFFEQLVLLEQVSKIGIIRTSIKRVFISSKLVEKVLYFKHLFLW